MSTTARHGVQPDYHVTHGMILGTQRRSGAAACSSPIGDAATSNCMEVKPDWGNDSGIFFRTTETGAAYQITMDYLPGGSMGRLISEGGISSARAARQCPGCCAGNGGGRAQAPDPGMTAWKREDWNIVRVRVAGDVPHATVWINDQQISDASDTENHALGGMIDGPIAIQIQAAPCAGSLAASGAGATSRSGAAGRREVAASFQLTAVADS